MSDVVNIEGTNDNGGYWLGAADGAAYAFGDAGYHGRVNNPGAPVVGLEPTRDGGGYWMVENNATYVSNLGDATVLPPVDLSSLNQPISNVGQ